MVDEPQLRVTLKRLLAGQLFAVLATHGDRAPHLNIVSFAPADELATVLFATPRQTRKFANLLARSEVSLFVDNRSNRARDLEEVFGIEISGVAREVSREEPSAAAGAAAAARHYREIYLARFPELEDFVDSPGTALVAVSVRRYDVVHRFQDVVVWELVP